MRIDSLIALALSTLMVACGHQADRGEDVPSTARGGLPGAVSNGVLTVAMEGLRCSGSTISTRLRLENISAHPLELRNLGDTLTGFCCIIDGQRFNAPVQRGATASAASSLSVLPPQTPVELDLSWHVAPAAARGYPFTVVVGNLFQDGTKLTDVYLCVGSSPVLYPASTSATAPGSVPRRSEAPVTPSSPAPTASATAPGVSM